MPASGQLGDTPRLRSVPNARTGTFLAHRLFASRQFHQHLSEVLALEELEEGNRCIFDALLHGLFPHELVIAYPPIPFGVARSRASVRLLVAL